MEIERKNTAFENIAFLLERHFGYDSPKAFVRTFGCQGNVADSEKIKGVLCQIGFFITENIDEADIIILNTCAIRENAQNRAFGNIGAIKKYKEKNPKVITALCGCMPEQEHVIERLKKHYSFLDLVFGTGSIADLPDLLAKVLNGEKMVIKTGNESLSLNEGLPSTRDNSFKAFLPVMYGCDNFCTYCVVPYVRGRERSRDFNHILDDAEKLISSGYKEITLLGQNVNSYGIKDGFSESFADLLRAINELEGDFWIRFMTSHPKDCSFDLLDAMSKSKKVAKHLHLPFQSGNNRVLKAMNRGYSREKYLELINYAKGLMPNLSITSDVIVGFPGESDIEFEDTLSLVDEAEFTSLFTFLFSPREGTAAFKMNGYIDDKIKSERFDRLIKLQEEIATRRNKSLVDEELTVLCESHSEDSAKTLLGRTEGNVIIEFTGKKDLVGSFQKVKVLNAKTWRLFGELA